MDEGGGCILVLHHPIYYSSRRRPYCVKFPANNDISHPPSARASLPPLLSPPSPVVSALLLRSFELGNGLPCETSTV